MTQEENKKKFQITDRRFWVQDDSKIDKTQISGPQYPSVVEELKARTELAEQKLKEKLQEIDKENNAFRRRLSKEMDKRLQREKINLLSDFLELVDNFERALKIEKSSNLKALKKGLKLNLKLFLDKLQSIGIESMDLLHQPFNPSEAEAVDVVPVEDAELDQKVVEVIQRGYRWETQLLRPAKVRIGQFQPQKSVTTKEEKKTPV